MYQKRAFGTWKNFYKNDDEDQALQKSYINGTLACFCNDQYKDNGIYTLNMQYREDGLAEAPEN